MPHSGRGDSRASTNACDSVARRGAGGTRTGTVTGSLSSRVTGLSPGPAPGVAGHGRFQFGPGASPDSVKFLPGQKRWGAATVTAKPPRGPGVWRRVRLQADMRAARGTAARLSKESFSICSF